jgi:hypothetical protein
MRKSSNPAWCLHSPFSNIHVMSSLDVFSGLVASSQDIRVTRVGEDHGEATKQLVTARAEFHLLVFMSDNVVLQSLVSESFFAGPDNRAIR